ncbi:MAG: DUF1127 domain-containing protein [Dongiaceae bacterium]
MNAIESTAASKRPAAVRTVSLPGHRLRHLLRWFWLRTDKARQRRALARLDDAALRDIGLTRADAAKEAAKPFWRG